MASLVFSTTFAGSFAISISTLYPKTALTYPIYFNKGMAVMSFTTSPDMSFGTFAITKVSFVQSFQSGTGHL
jgi:hypothetical protein